MNLRSNQVLDSYVDAVRNMIEYHREMQSKLSSTKLPLLLLCGPNGSGKTRIVESVCSSLSAHLCTINGIALAGESALAVEKRIENFISASLAYGPCILFIKSVNIFIKEKFFI